MAHFQMSTGGSKSNEHVDHFLVDIHRDTLHFFSRRECGIERFSHIGKHIINLCNRVFFCISWCKSPWPDHRCFFFQILTTTERTRIDRMIVDSKPLTLFATYYGFAIVRIIDKLQRRGFRIGYLCVRSIKSLL